MGIIRVENGVVGPNDEKFVEVDIGPLTHAGKVPFLAWTGMFVLDAKAALHDTGWSTDLYSIDGVNQRVFSTYFRAGSALSAGRLLRFRFRTLGWGLVIGGYACVVTSPMPRPKVHIRHWTLNPLDRDDRDVRLDFGERRRFLAWVGITAVQPRARLDEDSHVAAGFHRMDDQSLPGFSTDVFPGAIGGNARTIDLWAHQQNRIRAAGYAVALSWPSA